MLDAARPFSSFTGGVYAVYLIRGSVDFVVTQTGNANAVVNAVFFGPPPANAPYLETTTSYLVDTAGCPSCGGGGGLSQVVAETDQNGSLTAYYVRVGDKLLSVMRPGSTPGTWTTRYVHEDALGSVRALTDETGTVVDTRGYEAFGTRNTEAGSDPLSYGFAGEPRDGVVGLPAHGCTTPFSLGLTNGAALTYPTREAQLSIYHPFRQTFTPHPARFSAVGTRVSQARESESFRGGRRHAIRERWRLPMPLKDVTRWFKNPKIDWTLRGRAFTSQFDGCGIGERGVYAHLDMNSSELPIYDKNGSGKVIVLGSAVALKFGKFVGGLAGRMLQNHDHFHRRPPNGPPEEGIFSTVLTCLFVLDLTHRRHDEIRSIETQWNRGIRAELKRRALIHPQHRGRAESVNLARAISCEELLEIITPIAARVAA